MSQIAFYWGAINAIHNITLSLWIGSIFFYIFGLQSCLGLLDPTQKTSLQLQSLRKLFQLNWINAAIVFITQAATLFISYTQSSAISWSTYAAFIVIILMIALQFYTFTTAYRKARRAIRPKITLFSTTNTFLKIITLIGILELILLVF